MRKTESVEFKDYCGTTYAAKLLGLSVGTIQTLVEKNELQAWKTQGGHRRIAMSSIREYQRLHNILIASAYRGDKRIRVLLIENDPGTREMIWDFCSRCELPVECTAMSSGLDALIEISSIRPDVLITNLDMFGVDGFDLLRMLRGKPVFNKMINLVISELPQYEVEARGGLPEGSILVAKPLNMYWLKGFLAALIASKQNQPEHT